MRAATVVQQLCKSCRTCFKFYCMFYFTCDRSFRVAVRVCVSHSSSVRCGISNRTRLCVFFVFFLRIMSTILGGKQNTISVSIQATQKKVETKERLNVYRWNDRTSHRSSLPVVGPASHTCINDIMSSVFYCSS